MSFEISDNVEIFLVGIFDEELKECPVCISMYTHIQSGTFVASGKKDTPAVELCLLAMGTFPGNLQCFCSFCQVVQ